MEEREQIIPTHAQQSDTYGAVPPNKQHVGSVRQSEWHHTSLLLLAEVVGTGVLALPSDMAKLGWTLGMFFLLVCFALNFWAGTLLWRVQNFRAQIHTYADAAGILFGPREQLLTHVMLNVTLLLVMSNYLLVFTLSVKDMLYEYEICQPVAALIAAGILLIPSQLRTLHFISFASILSVLAVLIVLSLCLHRVLTKECGANHDSDTPFVDHSHIDFVDSSMTFVHSMAAISSFVFASGGQMIYLEMMSEMKEPRDFPKALLFALVVMLGVYILVAVVGYHCLGASVPSYVVDVLPAGETKRIASALMGFHVMVSYVLHQQVLTRKLHMILLGRVLQGRASTVNHVHPTAKRFVEAQLQWFVLSVCVLGAAYVVANTIPFFSDLVGLIGSLTQSLLFYVFPAMFFWRCSQLNNTKLSRPAIFGQVLLIVFGIGVFLFGTYSNLSDIVNSWSTYGAPFSCLSTTEK